MCQPLCLYPKNRALELVPTGKRARTAVPFVARAQTLEESRSLSFPSLGHVVGMYVPLPRLSRLSVPRAAHHRTPPYHHHAPSGRDIPVVCGLHVIQGQVPFRARHSRFRASCSALALCTPRATIHTHRLIWISPPHRHAMPAETLGNRPPWSLTLRATPSWAGRWQVQSEKEGTRALVKHLPQVSRHLQGTFFSSFIHKPHTSSNYSTTTQPNSPASVPTTRRR